MAPPAFSVLAAELPEFNPDFAPGMEGMDEGASDSENPQIVKEEQHAPHDYKESATGKPSSLADAFEHFNFPAEFHDSFLNLVGTSSEAPAEIVASLPFDSYREAVANHLVLEDGRAATLFEQGRFYKFFKDLVRLFAAPAPLSASRLLRCLCCRFRPHGSSPR